MKKTNKIFNQKKINKAGLIFGVIGVIQLVAN